ncbi:arylsulfotransferase family protein [Halorussus amylolyticus]|uniref:arylsulfotransferase family protein n=1 Tax=Halorussus amylolyticus TaxID=1126242 RepID=UPI00104C2897|nr:arylsulfotransferase family protein [Halorussus amylolyticus]
MKRRTILRGTLLAVIALSAGLLAVGWLQAPEDATASAAEQMDRPFEERDPVAGDRAGATVVTTDPPGANDGTAAIVAFAPDGRPLYHNDTYGNYFDVDPDPEDSRSVLYVAGSRYDSCPSDVAARAEESFEDGCAKVVVERANLTTGETERLHTAVTGWDIWHDVDRVGDDELLVADIAEDRAFVLNLTTDEREWTWNADEDYDKDESGGAPGDWTHINDVEALEDGRVMVSLRNHDRVAFVEPGEGVERDWTLGAEDAYDTLYEQHNPDYIPEKRGGPAVIVADSENNRVVEYQRDESEWSRSWEWSDDRLQWPRDADRLPNDHTLVTDSQGNRILELDEDDEVVWTVSVPTPYEAERLGTGDESAGGWSKAAIEGESGEYVGGGDGEMESKTGLAWAVAFLTGPAVNGVLYVAPAWMTVSDVAVAGALAASAGALLLLELRWSRFGIRSIRRRP